MSVLQTGWVVAAAACVSLALLQLMIWLLRRSEREHLALGLTSLAAAGVAITELRMSRAPTADLFVDAFKLSNYFLAILFLGLTWFVVSYAESRPGPLAWIAGGGWLAGLLLNAVRPLGLSLESISGIETASTPWGETYAVAEATTDATKALPDLATVAFIAMAAAQSWRLFRDGRHRKAIVVGLVAAFISAALVHTALVDFGLLSSPYLISFAFLAIVLLANVEVAAGIARASVLSERVREEERRWKSLLEKVELLVARIGRDGTIRYVNPFFLRVHGSPPDEIVGSSYRQVLPEGEHERVREMIQQALSGQPTPVFEALLETRDGARRNIVWRNVVFQDDTGQASEVLAVGADVTDRRQAEEARARAAEEIRALKEQLEEENLYLKEEIKLQENVSDIVGQSDPLRYVLFRIEQVAPTATTVLIQGETGVGKELVARTIHDRSPRSGRPYVRLNCAALPPNLVETELFGHVAGAFTDAKVGRKGRFEVASGGTLFLDEVSELPLEVQPKLLRVLQDGEFEPLGSSRSRKADVRLIVATNRNLEDEVRAGRFREDLYYRLHVYTVTVPPLRDRKQDIPLLLAHFLPRISARVGRRVDEVPAGVLRQLTEYAWPGNVRQLQNVLEEAVVTTTDGVLRLASRLSAPRAGEPSGMRTLAENEREHIRRVLESTHGQVAGSGGAGEILDLHPNTLRSRMKKLGLSAQEFTRV